MEISYYLKRPNVDVETVIFARISYDGYSFKYYIGEKIFPKFWNTKKLQARESKDFKGYPEFNQRLEDIKADIGTHYRSYIKENNKTIPTPEMLKSILDKELKKITPPIEHNKTFFGFFEEIITQSQNGGRVQPKTGKPYSPGTIQIYISTLNRLKAFQATYKRKIDFKTIDIDFYTELTEHLSKRLNLATNTIGKVIKNLKVILNEATERGLNENIQYKSKKFSTTSEQTDSIYLNEAELKELEELDLSQNNRLENVRDLFLVGCFTGLRYSDFSILSKNHLVDGFIEIKEQTKTGNPVIIPIHPIVKSIIAKYDGELPRSISNQKTNFYLKELGKAIPSLSVNFNRSITKGGLNVSTNFEKWELLTTHTARRSFATNEYLNGTPSFTIMAITGHRTEKSFLRYIKLTPKEHAEILKLHWANRNQLKAV